MTEIDGLKVITPQRFADARGFFAETWNRQQLTSLGIEVDFVQDNHSVSNKTGTVRGLHFQKPPFEQKKLVRCGRGRLFDVAVDVRRGSPTYGSWFGVELSAENGKQLFIPGGFLHGFQTLEESTEIIYKCSNFYAPEMEGVIRADDIQIGINWPLPLDHSRIAEKDLNGEKLADFVTPFTYKKL